MATKKIGPNKIINNTLLVLYKAYPNAVCNLIYNSAWELLLATILSAQTKDENVNKVTPVLFSKFPTLESFIDAREEDIQKIIYSCGFYRNKAKNIKRAANYIARNLHGKVPDSMEALVKIPGVARKTANVVLNEWFKKADGIVVDTHVKRVAFRLGWTKSNDPVKIEKDLTKVIPTNNWLDISHVLIEHGRKICRSQNPKCDICPVKNTCPYYKKLKSNKDKIKQ